MAGPTNPQRLVHSPSTQYEDGTPIAPGDIALYQYGFGIEAGKYTTIQDDLDLTSDQSGKQFYTVPELADGQWFAASRAVTKKGGVAEWGNEVPFVVAPKKPARISDMSAV